MANVQIRETFKANVTNSSTYSAPLAPAVLSNTYDASPSPVSRQKSSAIQDGCGSCTLLVASSFVVLGLALALFFHKGKRATIQSTVPEKPNILVRHHNPDPSFLVV